MKIKVLVTGLTADGKIYTNNEVIDDPSPALVNLGNLALNGDQRALSLVQVLEVPEKKAEPGPQPGISTGDIVAPSPQKPGKDSAAPWRSLSPEDLHKEVLADLPGPNADKMKKIKKSTDIILLQKWASDKKWKLISNIAAKRLKELKLKKK